MRKRPVLQLVVIIVIGCVILIPVGLIIPWFPTDASRQASRIHTLYDVLLIVTIPIFMLVVSVIGYSIWNFRMRPGEENKDGPPIHGNTRLEVVWTALPALLILSLCVYAYTVLRANENSKPGEMTINVTARQFAFEFSYPRSDGKYVVSSVLYLAKNQPVVFKLRSLDVIHSFFVPNFSEKLDAVPGITTTLRVTPTRTGTYPVECTELCGAGHSLMRVDRDRGQPVQVPELVELPAARRCASGRGALAGGGPARRAGRSEHVLDRDVDGRCEFVHERGRRQGRVHGVRRLQRLPHAGRGRRHRHRRPRPRHATAQRLRHRRVQEDPRRDAPGVHPYRDHQPLRLHPDGVHEGRDAAELLPDAELVADPGASQLPLDGGEVMVSKRYLEVMGRGKEND